MLQFHLGQLQLRQQGFLLTATLLQGFDLLLHGLALAIQLNEHIDLALDRMNIQRLVQKVHRAAFIALEGIVHLAPGGTDKHDGDVFGLGRTPHQLGQLKTIHAGHLHIQNGHRELVLQQQRQRFVSRQGLIHDAVLALDQRFEGQQVFRQIIDDQQLGFDFIQ
ncbi:MAG: NAD-specific glutamate dehydrogenase [Pseudomonas fragi]